MGHIQISCFLYGTLPTISNTYDAMYCLSIVLSMGKIRISLRSIPFPDMGMINWAMGMVWDDCHAKEWYGNGMGGSISPVLNPHLWKRYVFCKNPYYSHTWEWYGLWEWYGMIAMRGNGMGAYISPIPNPHLWERYVHYSYWGKLRYGGNSPIPISKLFKETTTLWWSFKVLLFKTWTH